MYRFLPTYVYKTVLDINYDRLKQDGYQNLVFDLDNTLLPYDNLELEENVINLFKTLNKEFNVYIFTNNHEYRITKVKEVVTPSGTMIHACKPYAYKIKKYFKEHSINLNETIMIGDQLLTDISCAHRLNVSSILVKSLDRNGEKWYTRLNRLRDKRIINKIKKIDLEKGNLVEDCCRK